MTIPLFVRLNFLVKCSEHAEILTEKYSNLQSPFGEQNL